MTRLAASPNFTARTLKLGTHERPVDQRLDHTIAVEIVERLVITAFQDQQGAIRRTSVGFEFATAVGVGERVLRAVKHEQRQVDRRASCSDAAHGGHDLRRRPGRYRPMMHQRIPPVRLDHAVRAGQRGWIDGQGGKTRHQAADQAAQFELPARRVGRRFERGARQDQSGQLPAAFRQALGCIQRCDCATHAMSHQKQRDLERRGSVGGVE